MMRVAFVGALLALGLPAPQAGPASAPASDVRWDQVLTQPTAWYATTGAARVADIVRAYQRTTGGWPKNIDMARPVPAEERIQIERDKALTDSTIDNGATVTQIRFLVRHYDGS